MFKRMRNQVLSSIVVLAMVFSLMPAIQVQEAKASDVLNVNVSVRADGVAAISCEEIEGATYELYRADSRFADYELIIQELSLVQIIQITIIMFEQQKMIKKLLSQKSFQKRLICLVRILTSSKKLTQ